MPQPADCGVCSDFKSTKLKFQKQEKQEKTQIPCPPDKSELGRSSWTLLHTMAAYYPAEPTESQQSSMNAFITGLSQFYPCSYCADHMKQEMEIEPPLVNSNI